VGRRHLSHEKASTISLKEFFFRGFRFCGRVRAPALADSLAFTVR
jgi:hypothetical protein